MAMWLADAEDCGENVPVSSDPKSLKCGEGEIVNLITADTEAWRQDNGTRYVRKTLTLPVWMNVQAERRRINFSRVLQDALAEILESPSKHTNKNKSKTA